MMYEIPHVHMTNDQLIGEKESLELEIKMHHPESKRSRELTLRMGRTAYEIACRIEEGKMSPYTGNESTKQEA